MREVNYLTDKSQDSEKLLSFKEQILRDLEEANEQLLKIEKEYDLPDRSIETPSSLKEEEEATPPPKEEAVVASTEIPVEPEKATPAVEEKSEDVYKRQVLNDVIMDAIAINPTPTDKGKRLKIFYATQVATKPPTFVVFVNEEELMHFLSLIHI